MHSMCIYDVNTAHMDALIADPTWKKVRQATVRLGRGQVHPIGMAVSPTHPHMHGGRDLDVCPPDRVEPSCMHPCNSAPSGADGPAVRPSTTQLQHTCNACTHMRKCTSRCPVEPSSNPGFERRLLARVCYS